MSNFIIRPYEASDETTVIELWYQCKLVTSWNDPHKEIQRKRSVQPELFLVAEIDGRVIATIMTGYEGHRGWLNYLAVTPQYQRQGIGQRMVETAIDQLTEIGCPKVNIQIRTSNKTVIRFYERLGFRIDNVISLGKDCIPTNDEFKLF
ncbi:MAG: GNAT family acetyltransferase [Plectolyngbya sp. WJT66-NPBG17]|nr:GNAT family acetyltransferase [Plectolyngbya sp. WJT66-NPBG17]